jgi:F420-dependent oxidoreductase-like protein
MGSESEERTPITKRTIGVVIEDGTTDQMMSTIKRADSAGVPAAWMISVAGHDVLTMYAAAAVQTEQIRLGTSVVRTMARHPITLAEQARTIWDLAPGRLALGVGPAHKSSVNHDFGLPYDKPLGYLEEYMEVLNALLKKGKVDFEGKLITARFEMDGGIDIPIYASALRQKSFEMCGRVADGAITWVCPLDYVRDVGMPALKKGADDAGRPTPEMLVHVPVCVTDDEPTAQAALRASLEYFPYTPNYAAMFELSGFPNSDKTGWTDELANAVMVWGNAETVQRRLNELFDWGASELVVTVLGGEGESWDRTASVLAELSKS